MVGFCADWSSLVLPVIVCCHSAVRGRQLLVSGGDGPVCDQSDWLSEKRQHRLGIVSCQRL